MLAALLLVLGPLTTVAAAAPASNDAEAIQQVIVHANDEQAQALASHDPCADGRYRDQRPSPGAGRRQQSLLASGVVAIKLVRIDWGQIDVNGSQATATTWETWSTTYDDGTSELSRDQNSYTLVKDGDALEDRR